MDIIKKVKNKNLEMYNELRIFLYEMLQQLKVVHHILSLVQRQCVAVLVKSSVSASRYKKNSAG